MPKYRQLHTKMVDSYDIASMPDDFTRFFYLTLIVVLDSSGRAIDNPAWLRSKAFPLREDVTIEQIKQAMDHFEKNKLIVRYKVNGNGYFFCPSFLALQTGLENEMKSTLPAPTPEQLPSKSEPTPKSVGSSSPSIQYNAINNTRQYKAKQAGDVKVETPFSPDDKKNWDHALGELYSTMNHADYDTWVKPLSLERVRDGTFTARAANRVGKEWLISRCKATMERALMAKVEITV